MNVEQVHVASSQDEAIPEDALLAQTDISLPLGLIRHQVKATDRGQYVIDYYSSFVPCVMQDFYEFDMERLGWRLLAKFDAGERLLLLFDKPQTWSIISIVTCSDVINAASKTTIFVGAKVSQ